MKKLLAIVLSLVMVLSMTACAKEETQPTVAEKHETADILPVRCNHHAGLSDSSIQNQNPEMEKTGYL